MSQAPKIVDESELPLNLEDLPNFKLKDSSFNEYLVNQPAPLEIATKFVKDLQNLVSHNKLDQKEEDELYNLYDVSFNRISDMVFKNSQWPNPQEIEEHDENFEIDITTQLLYTELTNRHVYARLQTIPTEIRVKSWENYKEIFEIILLDKRSEDVPLPLQWIWDIIDEFLYQFQVNCQWRAKQNKETEQSELADLDNINDFWNLHEITDILQSMIDKSVVMNKEKTALVTLPNLYTLQYFGYFSLVAMLRLHIMTGDYQKALESIQCIDYEHLPIYSKAYACYLSLFYYAGFAFLMTDRHRETVRIFETLLSFIGKYKQFYSKSFQFGAMNKQSDKTLYLLAIALVFYPTRCEETVQKMLQEKLFEKLQKLQTYDLQTFNDLFNKGCPKFPLVIKDLKHFKSNDFDVNTAQLTLDQRDKLGKQFLEVQNLNNISSVLRLYKSIPVNKAAQIFNMSPSDIQNLLQNYKNREQAKFQNTPFESTIVSKFAGRASQLDFSIENQVITVREVTTLVNYSTQYDKNISKLDDMINELDIADVNYICGTSQQ